MNRNITYPELLSVRKKANEIFFALKNKYSNLKGHLEFYGIYGLAGQVELNGDVLNVIQKYPKLLAEDFDGKKELFLYINKLADINKQKTVDRKNSSADDIGKAELMKAITRKIEQAEFNPRIMIVIIFDTLNYELIWKLQKDPLVGQNPEHTPQTKASIRIALGTLESLSG